MNNTNSPLKFERRVANIYSDLGYKVITETFVAGVNVDIIANLKIPGAGMRSLAIVCIYQCNGTISIRELHIKLDSLLPLKQSNEISEIILVTNFELPKNLKVIVAEKGFSHFTFNELSAQLFPIDTYLNFFTNFAESNYLEESYIDLHLSDTHDSFLKNQKIYSASNIINRWLKVAKPEYLLIKGAAGSGKTTICKKIVCNLAKRFQHDSHHALIPFIHRTHADDFLN